MPNKSVIPIGAVFGRWTVIAAAPSQKGRGAVSLKCECGTEAIRLWANVKGGRTKSCGCHEPHRKHGGAVTGAPALAGRTREYRAWLDMKTRCYNKRRREYKNYGGRGITVCVAWLNDFAAFLQYIGPCPVDDRYTVGRIDNGRSYEPGNVRWETYLEQATNRRSSRLVTFQGETLCLSAWARRLSLDLSSLITRINRGWPIERALTTPPQPRGTRGRRKRQ